MKYYHQHWHFLIAIVSFFDTRRTSAAKKFFDRGGSISPMYVPYVGYLYGLNKTLSLPKRVKFNWYFLKFGATKLAEENHENTAFGRRRLVLTNFCSSPPEHP
jgi:hypothetical protein